MTPFDRLYAAALHWRKLGGLEPPAEEWTCQAAAEGVAAARALAVRLDDPRPLEPAHLDRLHALSRAWEYCDAIPDIPLALHLTLGDWADALMDVERRSRLRRAELAPFAGRFAAEAVDDPRRALKWWLRDCKVC